MSQGVVNMTYPDISLILGIYHQLYPHQKLGHFKYEKD